MTIHASKISRWREQLTSENVEQRREAAQRLAQAGEQASTAAVALAHATDDLDESVCHWATESLENLRTVNQGDATEFARLLLNGKAGAAYWAATLLGRLGAEGNGGVPALAQTLTTHAELSVRERCAWSLGEIGPAARSAVEALRVAAESAAPRLASLALEALRRIEV